MASVNLTEFTRTTIIEFCEEFLVSPYLCYTEHGIHALFFTRLYNSLPSEDRYTECNGQKTCIIQKEYRMASHLGRSKKANWDISVMRTPIELPQRRQPFDYIPLAAVAEFGLNCDQKHAFNDIDRLLHIDANIDSGFVVHLYRLSKGGDMFSKRDWSIKSKNLCDRFSIQRELQQRGDHRPIEVFYGIANVVDPTKSGLWSITKNNIQQISNAEA